MRKAKRVIDYTLDLMPKLKDLREIIAETQQLSSEASISIERYMTSQDKEYYHIVITEYGDPM